MKKKLSKAQKKLDEGNRRMSIASQLENPKSSEDTDRQTYSQAMSGCEFAPKVDAQAQTEELESSQYLQQQETIDRLQTEINAVKKQSQSLQAENGKLQRKVGGGGYCSGCKVELMFQSEHGGSKTSRAQSRNGPESRNSSVDSLNKTFGSQTTEHEQSSQVVAAKVSLACNLPKEAQPPKIAKQESSLSQSEQAHLRTLEMLADENN